MIHGKGGLLIVPEETDTNIPKQHFKKINRRWENRRVKKISPSLFAWVIGREVSHGITHGTQVRKRTREDV